MAQLLVIYNQPTDPAAFDRYYYDVHIPLAKKVPGVRELTIAASPMAVAGTAPYLVASLTFDSLASLQMGMMSAEGQAAAGDLPNFASGGVTVLVLDPKAA